MSASGPPDFYGPEGLSSRRLDSLPPPTGEIRWLVVTNPSDEPFSGVAVLHADYRTRTIAPVIVADPEGKTVPSRLVHETIGAVEADGKRRWTFDLEFFCDCLPNATVGYTARFGEDHASKATEQLWKWRRKERVLPVVEHENPPQ